MSKNDVEYYERLCQRWQEAGQTPLTQEEAFMPIGEFVKLPKNILCVFEDYELDQVVDLSVWFKSDIERLDGVGEKTVAKVKDELERRGWVDILWGGEKESEEQTQQLLDLIFQGGEFDLR